MVLTMKSQIALEGGEEGDRIKL